MKFALGEHRITCRGDCWIAPGAIVIGAVVLENNASVWFNCVVRADPGFPVTLGRNVSVGHMAMLHGCTIGDGTLIGIKAVILNGAKIGRNCLIGANTLITEGKEIPDGSLVVGSPGKVVRQLREHEIKFILEAADQYSRDFKWYRKEMTAEE